MFDLLRTHINKRLYLTAEEFDRCAQFFVHRTVRKRQVLLQNGDVCRHLAFVNNGCLREYTIDHKGEEHLLQFAIEDWWISDLNSFLSGATSTHNIDALQVSNVFAFKAKILLLTKKELGYERL